MPRPDIAGGNRKTALVLLSVVLVFFFGVMLKYWLINHP